jgi:hypothetical protein
LGWTPSRTDDPYLDGTGEKHYADDTSVFITGDGFMSCGMNADCIAGLMAHEATHSWIELKIEQISTTNHLRLSEYTVAEEMYADVIAMQQGDTKQLLYTHYIKKAGECEQYFKTACSPQTMLESYYKIDLSNISYLVYGK